MSFGMYLLAFFVSPLYFVFRGRVLAALVNGFFYVLAVFLLLFFGLGVFVWFFCVIHAFWDMRAFLREKEMRRQAELIAERTASF